VLGFDAAKLRHFPQWRIIFLKTMIVPNETIMIFYVPLQKN